MNRITVFFMFALLLSVWSCSKKKIFQLGQSVELKMQEGASCTDCKSSLSVEFLDIMEDSRCPKNTTCIWAGKAVVKLRVNTSKQQIFDLTINGDSKQGNTKVVGDYSITFESLSPYPESGVQAKKTEKVLKVLVQKNRNRGKV